MELVKKNIHMDHNKVQAGTQITLEDDVNISDAKPDAGKLICDRGEVTLEEIKVTEDHVTVKGRLQFAVMYLPENEAGIPACMEGSLPFEEQVYMDGVKGTDTVNAKWDLEDLSVGMINSRKLSIQALISLKLYSEIMYDEETAVDLYHEEPVEYCKKPLQIAQMTVKKKDVFRVREEMELPQNYPNISQIIWESIGVENVEFRPLEEKLSIQGDIRAFFLYEGVGEEQSVRAFETIASFNGMIDCHGCKDGMIEEVVCVPAHREVEIRPDFDGEERIFGLELVLDLDINLYEEERLDILSGVYGVVKEVEAVSKQAQFRCLFAKPSGKTKVMERIKIQEADSHMMQMLHSEAQVRIESETMVENGIHVSGTLNIQAFYMSSDAKVPYGLVKGMIPFSYVLEVPDINSNCRYKVQAGMEQLAVSMIDSDELDVKAILVFRAVVFAYMDENIITDIAVSELDMNKLSELPGIVIYIAKEGDSLWDVGKRYYVPISQIKETNDLTSEEIKPGDKLLIVKGISN